MTEHTVDHHVGFAFAAVVLAMLPAVLDQTILATALPVIASDLGSLSDVSWVVGAYVVAVNRLDIIVEVLTRWRVEIGVFGIGAQGSEKFRFVSRSRSTPDLILGNLRTAVIRKSWCCRRSTTSPPRRRR